MTFAQAMKQILENKNLKMKRTDSEDRYYYCDGVNILCIRSGESQVHNFIFNSIDIESCGWEVSNKESIDQIAKRVKTKLINWNQEYPLKEDIMALANYVLED